MKLKLPPIDETPRNGYDIAASLLLGSASLLYWTSLWFLFESGAHRRDQERKAKLEEIRRLEDAVR